VADRRGLVDRDVRDTTDFRLVRHDPPPAWMADAIVYEIFPDRFASTFERCCPTGPYRPRGTPIR
jgi:alpha-glucosidase